MATNVCIFRPTLPEYDVKEILRYAGARGGDKGVSVLLEQTLPLVRGKFSPRICYAEYPVSVSDINVNIGQIVTKSANLASYLSGCESAVVFAATVGIYIDRLILKYSQTEPARALLLQAIGTERVEALCDVFCQKLKTDKAMLASSTRPRFSPGYGDLSLDLQRQIFPLLNCSLNAGITLNENLLMSPSKSVTAIVGIKKL